MKEGDFDGFERAEAIRLSRSEFDFEVQALDGAGGYLSFCPKPVKQEIVMPPKHSGDLLHRFDLGSHRSGAPAAEELPGPVRRDVLPESLEVFAEEIAPDCSEIVANEIGEADLLAGGEVLGPLEQKPTSVFQDRSVALRLEGASFLGSHLVNGLA